MTIGEKWYLMYDGSSPDGRGSPDYVGRTTDEAVARKFYNQIKKNPYSTGKVEIVDDKSKRLMS